MRKDVVLPALALAGGGAGAAVRYWQINTSLVRETMLFRMDTPATMALLALLAGLAVLFFVLTRGGREMTGYPESFYCPSAGYMTLMAAGGFLMFGAAALGLLEGMEQLRIWQSARAMKLPGAVNLPAMLLLTAVLSAAGGLGVLLLGKGNYRGGLVSAYPLLAVLPAYAVLPWVVWLYQENSRQPQPMFYVFTLLAAVCALLGLYFAACFAFQRPSVKLCLFFSLMGIVLLLTSLADRPSLFQIAISSAVVLMLLAQSYALLHNCFGVQQPLPEHTPVTE